MSWPLTRQRAPSGGRVSGDLAVYGPDLTGLSIIHFHECVTPKGSVTKLYKQLYAKYSLYSVKIGEERGKWLRKLFTYTI